MSSNEWKLASSNPSLDAHRDELDVVDMNVISNHEYKRNQLGVGGWEAEEFVWESVRYGESRQGGRDLETWNTCDLEIGMEKPICQSRKQYGGAG